MGEAAGKLKDRPSGVFTEATTIDISQATVDTTLSRVWSDDKTGEIAVSLDRILFDNLIDICARFLEPHGFSLNIENLLATLDSIRLAVVADVSSRPAIDGRAVAKRIMPSVYMHLPRKAQVGPMLKKFYEEIGRYETELARLQDLEAKSKKEVAAAVRDESGRKAIEILRQENQGLHDELTKMAKKLAAAEDAMRTVPVTASNSTIPTGIRSCVVRSVRLHDQIVSLKSEDSQFSVPLKLVGGVPVPNARTLCFYEGGILKSVYVFDPPVEAFRKKLATVMAVDGARIKLQFTDRTEGVFQLPRGTDGPKRGVSVVVLFAKDHFIDLELIDMDVESRHADVLYDLQTKGRLRK